MARRLSDLQRWGREAEKRLRRERRAQPETITITMGFEFYFPCEWRAWDGRYERCMRHGGVRRTGDGSTPCYDDE
jgi:hypothetical protein